MTLPDPAKDLPHRAPFLFVDRVVECADGAITATWRVEGREDFLRGHFPGDAIVPGVLITEALAQTAGLLLASMPEHTQRSGAKGFLAKVEMRFHAPVRPPATITLSARRLGGLGALHQFEVSARDGASKLASGTLVLAVPDATV